MGFLSRAKDVTVQIASRTQARKMLLDYNQGKISSKVAVQNITKGKGTGLGLSISYQIIVEQHGGKLWYDSTPKQGTEFTIQIPIRQGIVEA